jgi:cytochrome P450 family 33
VQRLANILPLNITRKTNRDVTIGNYHIGKGTAVMPLISVVHLDDRIFPDPQRFDPTRFLDDNGQLKKVDQLIPFSVGKRQCPGECKTRGARAVFLVFI